MTRSVKFNFGRAAVVVVTIFVVAGCVSARSRSGRRAKPNTLTKKEIAQGFKLLFDGKALKGFKSATKEKAANEKVLKIAWIAGDGVLYNPPKDKRSENISGSIVTAKQYSNFDFRVDYKLDPLPEGGHVNSGIKYFAYPNTELGLEYQLFNADAEVKGPHALADLYDLMPGKNKKANPPGKWNTVRIVSRGKQVQHYLNGRKVLEFERGGEEFRAAVAKSKFKNREKFGEAKQGHILLQDHGGGISFRNIMIAVPKD